MAVVPNKWLRRNIIMAMRRQKAINYKLPKALPDIVVAQFQCGQGYEMLDEIQLVYCRDLIRGPATPVCIPLG